MHTTHVAALLGASLAHHVFAADVYATFYTTNGKQISPNFDVGNGNCFGAGSPLTVSFSQTGQKMSASGPYCLTAYSKGGCPSGEWTGMQQFQNVGLTSSGQGGGAPHYNLTCVIAQAASYQWSTNGCTTTPNTVFPSSSK